MTSKHLPSAYHNGDSACSKEKLSFITLLLSSFQVWAHLSVLNDEQKQQLHLNSQAFRAFNTGNIANSEIVNNSEAVG